MQTPTFVPKNGHFLGFLSYKIHLEQKMLISSTRHEINVYGTYKGSLLGFGAVCLLLQSNSVVVIIAPYYLQLVVQFRRGPIAHIYK